jgi:hypothetical protein
MASAVRCGLLALAAAIVALSAVTPGCTRSCDSYENIVCAMFTVIDADTKAQLCGADTEPDVPACVDFPYQDAGSDCVYQMQLEDGMNVVTVSMQGYVTQSFSLPMDECGHLTGSGPSEIALRRAH